MGQYCLVGRRGMHCGQFIPAVLEFMRNNLPPQVLVVHLGENDLGCTTPISWQLQASRDLTKLVKWFLGLG